jgi:hypothetical protein
VNGQEDAIEHLWKTSLQMRPILSRLKSQIEKKEEEEDKSEKRALEIECRTAGKMWREECSPEERLEQMRR